MTIMIGFIIVLIAQDSENSFELKGISAVQTLVPVTSSEVIRMKYKPKIHPVI